jgi:hypothetical protein
METFLLKLTHLIYAAKKEPARDNLMKLFGYMANCCAHKHCKEGTLILLAFAFSNDQQALLQPTMMQCTTGVIMDDMQGVGAKK